MTEPTDAGPGRSVVPLWKQRRVQVGAAVAVVVLLAAVGLVVALGGDDDEEPEATAAPTTTEPEAPPVAPLTGLPLDDLDALERPVLVVKVDNAILGARPPQAALDVADVVYEEPVEGATRFAVLVHSRAPERVGPVRSTRFIDAGIVWPFGSVPYVYSGGTEDKVAAIRESPAWTLDESALVGLDARVRDPAFQAPHNLFALPAPVWAAAEDREPPAPLFAYLGDGDAFAGEPVTSIEIGSFSGATYTWDEAEQVWRREQLVPGGGRGPHLAESGEQVTPTNLVVQRIVGEARDSVVGDGEAWVLSAGRAVRGRWERDDLDAVTRFVDESGAEIALTPGTTWVHLVDEEPVLEAPPTAAP